MQIKISQFRLDNYYRDDPVTPGIKVCPSNGPTSVGVITEVGKLVSGGYHYSKKHPESVTVVWATGKKRGKRLVHEPGTLADFDKYMGAIKKAHDELESLRTEAETLGL